MRHEPLTVGLIAELLGGTVEGNPSVEIATIASLESAGASDVTFAADEKRAALLAKSSAAAAIVTDDSPAGAERMSLIRVKNVEAAVARLLEYLSGPEELPAVGVASTAVVANDAQVPADVRIGPGVVVGPRAKIGQRCVLCANVCLGADVEIGDDTVLCEGVVVRWGCCLGSRVRIGPNTVIGYDGFGYYHADGVHQKVSHIGIVVIEDDVEIGACSCVDRAKFGSTRIAAGTKIDNLVQIAHNVQIGRGALLAAQCGVAGSAKLGQYVVLGGNVGIRDNISIGSGVTCAAYTAVANDVPDGQTLFGIPAIPAREKFRQISLTARLPELFKRIRELEEKLKALESPKDH